MSPRIALLGALMGLAGCSLADGTQEHGSNGVSFRYPDPWHVTGFSTTNSPPRLAVASYPLPEDTVEGDCGGYEAVRRLPRDGALVIVIDYGSAPGFPERPDELTLDQGEFAEYECFGRSTMFRFRVGERDFQAHVALGAEASAEDRDRALGILASLSVEEPEPFVPVTRDEEDRTVMTVTFPDGTTAELVFPAGVVLEQFAIRPYSSGRLPSVARDFAIEDGDVQRALAARNDGVRPKLLAEYEDADGRPVGLWSVRRAGTNVNYLGFQFGRWAVLVYDYVGPGAMTERQRATWAWSFGGRETDGGWLVLEAASPLRLARAGEHAGPRLIFASGTRSVELVPGRCRPHGGQTRVIAGKRVQWNGGFADWCVSDLLRAQANGDREFLGSLIRRLEVREVAVASP